MRVLIPLHVEILRIENAMRRVIHREAAHLPIKTALLIGCMDRSAPVVRRMRIFPFVIILLSSLARLCTYLNPQVLVLLLQHVQLDHVVLLQIVYFLVETLDLYILQLQNLISQITVHYGLK